MRILRIFGIVVAVHLAAFMFVFAIPGCRSSTHRSSSRPSPADTAPIDAPAHSASSPVGAGGLDGGPISASPGGFGDAPSSASSTIIFPGNPAARQNPTRPDSPEAQVLATPPVADVVPAKTYTVAARDSLWTVAKKNGITENELAAANKLRSGATLRVGQKLIIPSKTLPPAVEIPAGTQTLTYKVKANETLAQIARRAGTTTAVVKSLNHLTSEHVRPGQELVLPASPSEVASEAKSSVAQTEAPKATPSSKPLKGGAVRYTVKPGEALGVIAKKFGVPLRDIATANHIANPASLRAGTELIIPAPKNGTTSSNATTSNAPSGAQTAKTTPTPEPVISPVGPSTNDASPIGPAQDASPISAPADNNLISPGKE